jgi:hypothetical protein
MIINIIGLFASIIGLIYGVKIFMQTKHEMILWWLAILAFSLFLELQWVNTGTYLIEVSDVFWRIRDISRTILTIGWFRLAYRLDIKMRQKTKKTKKTSKKQ